MEIAAIVVAAGEGRRAGHGSSKVFAPFEGRPILAHALDPFLEDRRIGTLVVVLRRRDVELLGSDALGGWSLPARAVVVEGGPTRPDSVRAGLAAVGGPADRIVVVHDGARPLVTAADLDSVLAGLEGADGAVVSVGVEEAVKRVDSDGWIEASLDRRELRIARTPQAFRKATLERALAAGGDFEDCAAAVVAAGGRVRVVEGSRANVKVTYPEDLEALRRRPR